MHKFFARWIGSVVHLGSTVFWRELSAVVWEALPCIGITMGALILGVVISYAGIPYLSFFFHWFFLLMPPLVAMTASPVYVPFLVRTFYARHGGTPHHSWYVSIKWACVMYALVAAGYWALDILLSCAPVDVVIGVIIFLAVALLMMSPRFFSFPIASIAALFPPMSTRPAREVWSHAQRMMWGELLGIIILFIATMPCAYGGYCLVVSLLRNALITRYGAYCLLHALNIVCWQLSWLAFMVFYQQRKKQYIK